MHPNISNMYLPTIHLFSIYVLFTLFPQFLHQNVDAQFPPFLRIAASDPARYFSLASYSPVDPALLVKTHSGYVLGLRKTLELRRVTRTSDNQLQSKTQKVFIRMFSGIPYGKPPVGKLRFRAPQPVNAWTEKVFNATLPAEACVQMMDTFFGSFEGSLMWNPVTAVTEDCLTLTIWTPFLSEITRPLPVLIWIYGGGFSAGATSIPAYDFSSFTATQNVIVVAINYRLGSLGFLFTGDANAPGNMGLLDQLMGIRWVRENIRQFGGDPDQITLVGESAGAVSIGLHLQSPLAKGLFRRAILQSGAATCPWGIETAQEGKMRSLALAYRASCLKEQPPILTPSSSLDGSWSELEEMSEPPEAITNPSEDDRNLTKPENDDLINLAQNSDSWIRCLQKVDPTLLITLDYVGVGMLQFPFLAVPDGVYLRSKPTVGQPLRFDENHGLRPEQLLMGSVSEESFFFLFYHLENILNLTEKVRVTRDQLEHIVRSHFQKEDPLLVDAILSMYTYWPDPISTTSNRDALDKLFGDMSFTCHVNEAAYRYSEAGVPVYSYFFHHRSSKSPWPKWAGVLHADEIAFLIGNPLNATANFTLKEGELSERMMKMWSNFAKTGNPLQSLDNELNPIREEIWPIHSLTKREYKNLGINDVEQIGSGPRLEKCNFWLNYLPNLKRKLEKIRQPCNAANSIYEWCSLCSLFQANIILWIGLLHLRT